ncbi:MAG TPA: hypothetical protein VEA38_16340, partial [Terriglobales bacterium]|nr:hypothetical protein [Terriglobales bacterium]
AVVAAADAMREDPGDEGPGKVKGRVFNIGGGSNNTLSVLEAVKLVEEATGEAIRKTKGPGRAHEDMLFVTDYSEFQKATSWTPLTGVGNGVGKVLEWARLHREPLRKLYATEVRG